MNRRTFLRTGGTVAGLLALSGCTEAALKAAESPPPFIDDRYSETDVDLPVRQKFEVVADAVTRADGETFGDFEAFEAYLTDEGVAVEALEERVEEGELVGSLSHEPIDGALVETVGVVAGGYAALVRGDHDVVELTAELLDSEGRPFGEYEVFTTWAEEYDADESSAAEYGHEVLRSMESIRG